MTFAEAARLAVIVRADPSSALAAAMEGWDHPVSREELALYDLFDRLGQAHSTKPIPPHPGRPGKQRGETKQRGSAAGRTPDEVKAILRGQFGHGAPV